MTDKNYNTMTRIELKQECIKRGLSNKGVKGDLIRILSDADYKGNTQKVSKEEALEKKEPVKEKQTEDLQKEIEELQHKLSIAEAGKEIRDISIKEIDEELSPEKIAQYKSFLLPERLEDLSQKIGVILAGKANFNIDPNTRLVSFSGGPKVQECTTLIDSDKSILNTAKRYVARVFIGKNAQTSVA